MLPSSLSASRLVPLSVSLALLLALPATGLRAQVDLTCSESFVPVDPALLNPVFAGIFDLAVDWDLKAPDAPWNADSLRIFAASIIDEWPDNNEDLLNRLIGYFSEDLDDSYAGVRLQVNGGEYERFHICLRSDVGNIYSAGNRVELACVVGVAPGEERVLSALALAQEGFAHEWQHVTYDRVAPGPKFNGNTGTSEFLSKCAEYFAGMDHMWPVHDNPYERSYLGGHDYYGQCIGDSHANHKYGSFALFGAYLIEHFRGSSDSDEDDLLRLWLNSRFEDPFGNILYRISPSSLAGLLADESYDDYFAATDSAARLEELFHEFALSLWVNSPSLGGEATVWAGGRLPQEAYQIFRNVNGLDCADDARSLPLAVSVGEKPVSVSGPLYPEDVYGSDDSSCDSGHDSRDYPRYPQVATYGSSYLPFIAAADLPPDRCSDLVIDLTLLDHIYCESAGQEIPLLGSPNQRLNLSILGYPSAADSLDLRGAEAVLISEQVLPLASLPQLHGLRIPCFGSAWQAVVLVLSVTEQMPSQGYIVNRIFPFAYQARAEAASLPAEVDSDEAWGGEGVTLCMDQGLRVRKGASLTLLPGTRLLAITGDLEIAVEGELLVQGEPQGSVTIAPAPGAPESWGAILVGESGRLEMHDAAVAGLNRLVGAAGSRMELNRLAWDCGPSPGVLVVGGEGSRLANLEIANLGCLHMSEGRLDSSRLAASALAEGPLLELSGNVERCSYLKLEGARRGIHSTAAHTWIGPEVEVIAADLAAGSPWGLRLSASSRVNTYALSIRGFETGIVCEDAASLVLRGSTISQCELGVFIESDAGITDLGAAAFGGAGQGRNNFYGEGELPPHRAIENRSPRSCLAQWNYWGSPVPSTLLFLGPVNWQPYALEHMDSGGVGARLGGPPAGGAELLAATQPGPGSALQFRFSVSGRGRSIRLRVYDVAGRRVAEPISGRYPAGEHSLSWEPRGLPAGIYFARFVGAAEAHKIILLR